ncbi:glutamate dehydrogenase, partial [mine drainage metagenome]
MASDSTTVNPFETAKRQVDIVADLLHLEGGVREVLKSPKRELTVNFPVRLRQGRLSRVHRLS